VTLSTLACEPERARSPHDLRPVPEERAADIIGRTFRTRDVTPERNRVIHLARDREIRLAVAAADHRYGVAYMSDAQALELGDAVPKRPAGSDALVVVRGEKGARILVLFENDYVEDDADGERHTTTTIAVRRKIERDVRDFLEKAIAEGWP